MDIKVETVVNLTLTWEETRLIVSLLKSCCNLPECPFAKSCQSNNRICQKMADKIDKRIGVLK